MDLRDTGLIPANAILTLEAGRREEGIYKSLPRVGGRADAN
jgi:hypothetical protein